MNTITYLCCDYVLTLTFLHDIEQFLNEIVGKSKAGDVTFAYHSG